MKRLKASRIMLILPAILVLATVAACIVYNILATAQAEKTAYTMLEYSSAEQIRTLNAELDGRFTTLEAYAHSFSGSAGYEASSPETAQALMAMQDGRYFTEMFISDAHGNSYDAEGNMADVSDRLYYTEAMAGRRAIQYVETGRLSDTALFGLSVPVVQGGRVIGVLAGAVSEQTLCDVLITEAYGGQGFSFVCDAAGEIVIHGEHGELADAHDLFSVLYAGCSETAAVERATADIASGAEGSTEVTFEGKRRYAVYSPTGINDWMLVTVVPGNIIDAEVAQSAWPSVVITVVVGTMSIGMLIFLYANQRRNTRQTERERRDFRVAALQNGRMLRIFDIKLDMLINAYGDNSISWRDTPEQMAADGLVSSETAEDYLEFYNGMRRGEPSGATNAQLKNAKGEMRWYHADYTLITDEKGRPDHAVISVFDNSLYMEREFAYAHWENMINALIAESAMFTEANLTHNRIEREMGDPKYLVNGRAEETLDGYLQYNLQHFIYPDDAEAYHELMRRDRLVMMYYDNQYEDEGEIRLIPDGGGRPRWFSVRISMTGQPSTGDVMLLVTYTDIDDAKREHEKLTVMAHHDSMTGLYNRETLERRVTDTIAASGADKLVAMFLIDLDNFKSVNDNYGHQAGDELLIATAAAVAGEFRQGDVVGRIGGDEFMAFMAGATLEIIENRARELVRAVRLNVQKHPVTASVGVYVAHAGSAEYDAMYRMSDEAMYMAKDAGKGGYHISCSGGIGR